MDDVTPVLKMPLKQYPLLRDSRQVVRLWLCDVHKSRPEIEGLSGFDVSADSFLKPHELPATITLSVLDATGPVPEELRGKYDVVHLRLVAPAIPDGDPAPLIAHAFQLLRPGGYLQWEEFDPMKLTLHDEETVTKPSNLEGVANMLPSVGRQLWVANLDKTLENSGFQVLAFEHRDCLPWHRLMLTFVICQVVIEIAYANLDVNGPPGLGDTVRARAAAAIEESTLGSYACYKFQTVVAQRAT